MKETNMIKNIPTADEFYLSGKELLNFSWNILITLLKNLNEATTFLMLMKMKLYKIIGILLENI